MKGNAALGDLGGERWARQRNLQAKECTLHFSVLAWSERTKLTNDGISL